jgi:hypothetical protein
MQDYTQKTWGFHGRAEYCFLGCTTMQLGRHLKFTDVSEKCAASIFREEEFLQNADKLLPQYIQSQLRKHYSSRLIYIYIVTCLHCPLHGNGSINMFLHKHIQIQQLTALLDAVFSVQSNLRLYKENQLEFLVSRECEQLQVRHQPVKTGH